MSAQDMVDAALAQGELVTIPALPNVTDWNSFESARKAVAAGLSRAVPAPRYAVGYGNT